MISREKSRNLLTQIVVKFMPVGLQVCNYGFHWFFVVFLLPLIGLFLVFWRVIEIRSFRRTVFTSDVDFPQHVINLCSHKMCELLDSPLKVKQCTVIGRESSSFQFLVNRL